ncbi:unnamed protein product [Caenorhabditis angaria]|uniref:Uncharacterized protein n=1 Tax=Caenorhabditis angaria TaxID=860376 RepID=A0A9P1IA63_9PELO|nr:unnamed protein product [Caenorhabditis angaria]
MPPLKKKVKAEKSRKKNIKRRQVKKDKKNQARLEAAMKDIQNLKIGSGKNKKLPKLEKRKLKLKKEGEQRIMKEFKNLKFD